MQVYLNLAETRALLGVSEKRANWSSCSSQVGQRFHASMDPYHPTRFYVSNLLERGVRVLNYAGTFDFICKSGTPVGFQDFAEDYV